MTATADAPADTPLHEHISQRLAGPSPVTLADLTKGFTKPRVKRGQPRPDSEGSLREAVAEAVREGRAFSHPSGKGGAERYWHRDEAEAVRQAVLAAAGEPRTPAELKRAGATGLKMDAGFVDGVVRGLIGEDRLFEYPPKTKAGGPRFATAPPPPPAPVLETKKFSGDLGRLVTSFVKLQAKAGVSTDELFAAVRARVGPEGVLTTSQHSLADLILKVVAGAGPGSVLSLADVRAAMPPAHRGKTFDAAVFELADAGSVRIYQDGEPAALSAEERRQLVADDNGHVFRTIKRAQQ